MTSTSTGSNRAAVLAAALLLLAGAGCSRLGIGAKVTDLGDGRYKIATSQADDVEASNTAAAKATCPAGYTILGKGVQAEALYGSLIQGAPLATTWTIKCK
jgi:hypothetical protein